MDFDITLTYDAPLAQVKDLLRNPDFYASRFNHMQDIGISVDLVEENGVLKATTAITVPPSAIPEKAKNFFKQEARASLVETWDSGAEGTLRFALEGFPISLEATSSLKDLGATTERTLTGKISCLLPLVGKSLEAAILKELPRITEEEEKAAAAFLKP
ncbi:MAG: DUF2505 domain-containing protein [Actinomycetaceae bacterium]|nr:DUF2505 domain-containing protein [Actinomycetaceae bacterium]